MNCAHCDQPLTQPARGKRRKYCSKRCANKAYTPRTDLVCNEAECDRPRAARGLCKTHYNRTLPNRHRHITVPCGCCGKPAKKEARTKQRYENQFCSTLCRDYHRYGPVKSTLPRNHWARWYGRASAWKPPAKTTTPYARNTGACGWCDRPNPRGVSAAYCSPECKQRAKRVRRIGREHGAPGAYTYGQLVRLWQAFDRRCAYCQTRTPLADIQAEHVVPLSRGGANHVGNILPSCGPCNSDKRDLLLTEWNADRARRGLKPVRTEWEADDKRFAHLHRTSLRLAA